MDAHAYIIPKLVLELLLQKPSMSSFREEFLPWLCKLQYQPKKREKYAKGEFSLIKSHLFCSSFTVVFQFLDRFRLLHSLLNGTRRCDLCDL